MRASVARGLCVGGCCRRGKLRDRQTEWCDVKCIFQMTAHTGARTHTLFVFPAGNPRLQPKILPERTKVLSTAAFFPPKLI